MTTESGQPDLHERLATAVRGNVSATIAAMLASLASQVWLARRAGPTGLGEYNATSLFVTVLTTLALLGLPLAVTERLASRYEASTDRARDAMEGAAALTAIVCVVVVAAVAVAWTPFANAVRLVSPASEMVITAAAVAAVVQAFVVAVLLAQLRMRAVTAVVVAQPATVAAGLAASYLGPWADGSVLAATGFIASGVVAAVLLAPMGIRPRFHREQVELLIRRTVPNTTRLYFSQLSTWIDRLVVVFVVGPAGLGAFVSAGFLTEAVLRVPRTTGSFGVSAYALLADDAIGVRRVMDSQVRLIVGFLLVVGSMLFTGAEGILTLVFGPGFAGAATTLRILAVALVPMGITLAVSSSAVAIGRHGRLVAGLAVLPLLQIALGLVGTRLLSIAGMAISSVLLWCAALALLITTRRDDQAVLVSDTALRIAAITVPLYVIDLLLSALPVPWPVRVALGAAIAVPSVMVILIGDPERRVLHRIFATARLRAAFSRVRSN